ncbi:MAG: hypothetical protein ABIH66_13280 [bacterium]
MKKSVEQMLPEVWRALWRNPVIFVPPVAVFFLFALITAGFSAIFLGSIVSEIHNIGDLYSHFAYGNWPATVADFTIYTALMLCAFLTVVLLILLFHSAGWGNMFARAAATGVTSLGDYFGGISRFTVRVSVGVFLKQCIHLAPALFCAALWAVFMIVFAESRAVVSLCFLLLLPPFIVVQGLICFFLSMWRPALFIEDLPVVEAFGRSYRVVRGNWLSLILIFVIRFAGTLLVFGAFSVLTTTGQHVLRELENVMRIPLGPAMSASAGLLSWLLGFVISVFFTLYFYVFYHNRGIEEAAASPSDSPAGDGIEGVTPMRDSSPDEPPLE